MIAMILLFQIKKPKPNAALCFKNKTKSKTEKLKWNCAKK